MVSVFSMDLHLDIRSNMGVLKMLEGIPIYVSFFFIEKKSFKFVYFIIWRYILTHIGI